MNTDLIIKLAKLANNNPNENEANLAARKVCRLLAEGKFKFSNEPPLRGKSPVTSNPSPNQYPPYWDKYREQQKPKTDKKEPEKPKPKKQLIKCTKCGKENLTAFIGHPGTYVCNECVWIKYN